MTSAVPVSVPEAQSAGLFHASGKRRIVLCLLLLLLTLAAYRNVGSNGFVGLDDPGYITENAHVRAGLTWDTFKWAFRSSEQANWHPLTWLSHALDCQLFRLNPAGHHFSSVFLHGLVVILLFLLLDSLTQMPWRSLAVAAIFAVHPVNVESVAWISERKNLLCAVFFLLGLASYAWYARKPSVQRYSLLVLTFVLALLSKPMVITFPFVLLLLDYWPLGRMSLRRASDLARAPIHVQSWSRLLLEKIPLFALSAVSAVVTVIFQKSGGAMRHAHPLAMRLPNALIAYVRYLEKAVWPVNLPAFYPYPLTPYPAFEVIGAIVALVSLTLAVWQLRRYRYLLVGWLWFLGTLVPVIGLVQVGDQAMADRYQYIPLMGLLIAAIWGIGDWAASKHIAVGYLAAAASVIVGIMVFATQVQSAYWHNTYALWTHTLAITKDNYFAHVSLGADFLKRGMLAEARTQFRAADAINPTDAMNHLDLGVCEQEQGNLNGALGYYESALQLTDDPSVQLAAYTNLGATYRISQDYSKARLNYESALKLVPNDGRALMGLGLVEQKTGNLPAAIDDYARSVASQPSDSGYLLLAQALAKAGRNQDALAAAGFAQEISADMNRTTEEVKRLLQE